uniref:Glycosyltransferase 61 catalytic domain-containing protein n=1 Tax=viral metagenome TaxID=1070528 RepID=A0A6C0D0I5_9ZZZZ
MRIAVYLDQYSGHLFHDVEIFIFLYKKLVSHEKDIHLDFITATSHNTFQIPHIVERNQVLCKKLFDISFHVVVTKSNNLNQEYDMVIDRFKVDTRDINKFFATSILDFPEIRWANALSPTIPPSSLKILYATRQNSSYRKLTDDSHSFLTDLVLKYNGTICNDLTNYSIEDQIELYRSHNCVIGVHGNNLTGIMWMKPQSHVFEILPFHCKFHVYDYHCMSLCMKHQYTQLNGLNAKGESHNCVMDIEESCRNMLENHLFLLFNIMREI